MVDQMTLENSCKICTNKIDNKIYKVKEMMFGLGDSFDYLECHNCGYLQIVEIPSDMKKYYDLNNYYSFKGKNLNKKKFIRKSGREEMNIFYSIKIF